MNMRPVVIYRDQLVHPFETFILDQAEALNEYTPYYVGTRRVNGLIIPTDRVLLFNSGSTQGKVSELMFKMFGNASAMVKLLKRINPMLLHAHFGPDGVRVMPLARSLKKPLIVTFHGSDATMYDSYAKRSYYGQRIYVRRRETLFNCATRIIAVSNYIRERLLNQGFPEKKVKVHYIGVDTHCFCPRNVYDRKPIVLFVGRLVENKGCAYLIDAMAKVRKSCWNAELVIIGDGPLRSHLESRARANLLRCRFLGVQTPEQVREWMARASVFSVPSVTAPNGTSEGFGIVFAEAQAMALPVVSFSTGGIPEAVIHGTTGFLVNPEESLALSDSISCLLNDRFLCEQFGSAGRAWVCHQHNLRKQTVALEKIYADVIAETV